MWKILTAASTAIALIGAPASAQVFGDWAGDDQYIGYDEFGPGFEAGGAFDEWDVGDDDLLDENEWRAGVYDVYDADDDDFWTEDEFGVYADRDWGAYEDWDADESGFLTADEFGEGVYGAYDVDDDELWTEEEFGFYEDDDWF